MAVINPPGFLQNAGATHTAEALRSWFSVFSAGKVSTTSLIARGGVKPDSGSALQVTQTGSPSMAVIVKSGLAAIPGSEGTKQGVYLVENDADFTISITTAHATLNRIDSIVFKVQDTAYSGAINTSSLVVVDGTPAGSPSPPTLPANSIELARVSVVALDTSITNGEITDRRAYLAATGGMITCTSTTRPAANTVTDGQEIYETDTDRTYITHDSGTTWTVKTELFVLRDTLVGSVASRVITIPSTLQDVRVKWRVRCDNAVNVQTMSLRINANAGAIYSYELGQANDAVAAGVSSAGVTSALCGYVTGTSAAAGVFGAGTLDVVSWDTSGNLAYVFQTGALGTGVANFFAVHGHGICNLAGPYTTITFLPQAGNMIAGSSFLVTGIKA